MSGYVNVNYSEEHPPKLLQISPKTLCIHDHLLLTVKPD